MSACDCGPRLEGTGKHYGDCPMAAQAPDPTPKPLEELLEDAEHSAESKKAGEGV